jgi:hypothetical protein
VQKTLSVDCVQVIKLNERSKKLDEQMATAQAKLAEMKKTLENK